MKQSKTIPPNELKKQLEQDKILWTAKEVHYAWSVADFKNDRLGNDDKQFLDADKVRIELIDPLNYDETDIGMVLNVDRLLDKLGLEKK